MTHSLKYSRKAGRGSGGRMLHRTMPSAIGYLQTRTSTLSPSHFLEAEARGSRARQKYASIDAMDKEHAHMTRLKSRITLAKVKGYRE